MTIREVAFVRTEDVSYEQYCSALTASFSGQELAFIVPSALKSFIEEVKSYLETLGEEIKIGWMDLVKALSNKDVFAFLKAIRFNLTKLLVAVQKALGLVKQGLFKVFEKIEKEGWLDKLKQGTAKIDDVLNRFPILKKMTGPVIAGLLFYVWLNMAFTGDLHYDMDLSGIVHALSGSFSLTDLFATPNGLATLTLFIVGTATGLSFPWLGHSLLNLLLGVLYTGAKKAKMTGLSTKLHQMISKKKNVEVSSRYTLSRKEKEALHKTLLHSAKVLR